MGNIVKLEKEKYISDLENGVFENANIYEWTRNYRFEYLYALIEGLNNNLDLNLMHSLVCELNHLYNCPNAGNWQNADDLTGLYTYLGLYGEMAITEDYNSMIELWNRRLKVIYKDMLTKIKEICILNEKQASIILDLYNSLSINLEEEGVARKLTNSNIIK